jgi:hypothetical protein
MMHSFAKFRFDFLQLGSFPLAHRPPQHRERPFASLLATDVRKAKKVGMSQASSVLDELHQPFMVQTIEERADYRRPAPIPGSNLTQPHSHN